MSKIFNKATITTGLATTIISSTKLLDIPPNLSDGIQTAAPILAHGMVAFSIWFFLNKGFETIDEMQEKRLKNKQRNDIQQDIDIITSAIESGHLTEDDKLKKRKELSDKYTELTSISTKPASSA
tara:strand:+ start:21535 stop:21909 length:375 start_codon:yes stop_codon:yes gene_type:complete